MRQKVEFTSNGQRLSGALETPESDIRCYALFAHCFTCGKDVAAASRIARALTGPGIAVLRFDFTGLGNSDGDFANTNFSSNLQDLVAASDFLRDNYEAPALLIGLACGTTSLKLPIHLTVVPGSHHVRLSTSPTSADSRGHGHVQAGQLAMDGDFRAMRDYRAGYPTRLIDWRASSRRNSLTMSVSQSTARLRGLVGFRVASL